MDLSCLEIKRWPVTEEEAYIVSVINFIPCEDHCTPDDGLYKPKIYSSFFYLVFFFL
jgi:hypothetical protein